MSWIVSGLVCGMIYACANISVIAGGRNKPPPDEFTGWAQWTRCSKTCGGGARARRRVCALTEDGGFVDCRGETLEIESCNTQDCPSALIFNCDEVYFIYL